MSSAINHKKRSGYSYADKRNVLNLSARRARAVSNRWMNSEHASFIDVVRRFFNRGAAHKEG